MTSTRIRPIALVVTGAVLAVAALAGPAGATTGARRASRNSEFCDILTNGGDLGADVNPDSADFAIGQIGKLLATDPPARIKKALRTIRKAYRRIAAGQPASQQLLDAANSFTTFSKYIVKNCKS